MQSRSNNIGSFLFTFLFPFGGLIASLSHWRASWAKNVFWIACVYLGAVLIFLPEGTELGDGGDGGRYVLQMLEIRRLGLSLEGVLVRHFVESGGLDLYFPVVAYFVSQFTDNGHVLFAIFAFVYGFFYSRNIWYVIERMPQRKLGWLVILFMLYFLACPITGINGVRMWTALHIYVYAMMPYIWERDKTKLWFLVLSPIVHFSFLGVVAVAMAYILIPERFKSHDSFLLKFLLVTFIVSMFVSSLNLTSLNSAMNQYAPEAYEKKINSYVDEGRAEVLEESAAEKNWYITASGTIQQWSSNLLVIFMFPLVRKLSRDNQGFMGLYLFVLLIGVAANILVFIPSGGRFQNLANMFKIPLVLLVVLSVNSKNYLRLVKPTMLILIIPLVVQFRAMLDFFSITAIMGNFFTVFFYENNVPLIDFIKRII